MRGVFLLSVSFDFSKVGTICDHVWTTIFQGLKYLICARFLFLSDERIELASGIKSGPPPEV